MKVFIIAIVKRGDSKTEKVSCCSEFLKPKKSYLHTCKISIKLLFRKNVTSTSLPGESAQWM